MLTVNNNMEGVPKEAALGRFGPKFDFTVPGIKTEVSLLLVKFMSKNFTNTYTCSEGV
jgi:hypothetical protein